MLRGQRSDAAEPKLGDPALLRQLAAGQLGALGELYDRYQAPLRLFLRRATGDAHDTDDLLHATFLAAAASAERYDGRANCRPWLVGIAVQLLRRGFIGPGWAGNFQIWFPQLAEARKTESFKQFVRDIGWEKMWRTSGDWGDFCKPVSDTDFTCT